MTGTNGIAKPHFLAEKVKPAQHAFDDEDDEDLKGETSRDLVSSDNRSK